MLLFFCLNDVYAHLSFASFYLFFESWSVWQTGKTKENGMQFQ